MVISAGSVDPALHKAAAGFMGRGVKDPVVRALAGQASAILRG